MQNGKSNGYDDEEDSEGMHSLPTRCIEDPIKAEPCKPDAPLPGSTVLRMYSHPGCPFSHVSNHEKRNVLSRGRCVGLCSITQNKFVLSRGAVSRNVLSRGRCVSLCSITQNKLVLSRGAVSSCADFKLGNQT